MHLFDPIKHLQAELNGGFLGERMVSGVQVVFESFSKFLLDEIGPHLVMQLAVYRVVLRALLVGVALPLHGFLQRGVLDDQSSLGENLDQVI